MTAGRIATVQALGGTGGLKVGADFLQAAEPGGQGPDQRPELGKPPRAVHKRRLRGRDLPVLRRRRRAASTSTACCGALRGRCRGHDRRAARLLPQPDRLRPDAGAVGSRWSQLVKARGLVPFLDMAYQGFGEGIAEDGAVIGQFCRRRARLLRRDQLFKSFSLYGERVGALASSARAGRGGARAAASSSA